MDSRFDLLLEDFEGKTFSLKELLHSDKLNLILFYNNDCLGCTGRALPLAYRLSEEYSFIQLIVIHSAFGNRSYSVQDLQEIFVSGKSPFPIYMESGHELFDAFECEGTPHWLLIDGNGNILHSIFGSQERSQMKLEYAIEEFGGKSIQ